MRATVRRYYKRNASQIIVQKTLRLARERGRVPREKTIQSHNMNRDELVRFLIAFQTQHPESRAARKIERFLLHSNTSNCD